MLDYNVEEARVSLQKASEEIRKLGIEVYFSRGVKNQLVITEEKILKIFVSLNQNLLFQLHTLLHEVGHYFLRKDEELHKKNFPNLYFCNEKNKNYKVDMLREEVLAWEKGYEFAKSIGIQINDDWWNRHTNTSIESYAYWIAEQKGKR
jgi:hypothetical protein